MRLMHGSRGLQGLQEIVGSNWKPTDQPVSGYIQTKFFIHFACEASCMHRMQEDPGLAKQGCSFMRTVAKYEKFQESINVAGGVEATICALKNNRLNISVQKEGWNALVIIATVALYCGNISCGQADGGFHAPSP